MTKRPASVTGSHTRAEPLCTVTASPWLSASHGKTLDTTVLEYLFTVTLLSWGVSCTEANAYGFSSGRNSMAHSGSCSARSCATAAPSRLRAIGNVVATASVTLSDASSVITASLYWHTSAETVLV